MLRMGFDRPPTILEVRGARRFDWRETDRQGSRLGSFENVLFKK